MAHGDVLRLSLKGASAVKDPTWVPGALASTFPVDVVRMSRPVGDTMDVFVRVRGRGRLPTVGGTLRSISAFSVPGLELPQATIAAVDALPGRSAASSASIVAAQTGQERGVMAAEARAPTVDAEPDPMMAMKVVGSLALIGIAALLVSRIEQKEDGE